MKATHVVELRHSKGVEKETRPTTQGLLVSEQKPNVHLLLLESFFKKKKYQFTRSFLYVSSCISTNSCPLTSPVFLYPALLEDTHKKTSQNCLM